MHKPIGLSPFAGRSACTESTIMTSLNRPRVCRLLLSEMLQQVSQLRLLAVVAVNLHDYISLSLSVCLSFFPSPPPPSIHPYIRTRCKPLPSPHQSIRTQIIFHCVQTLCHLSCQKDTNHTALCADVVTCHAVMTQIILHYVQTLCQAHTIRTQIILHNA